MNKLLRKYGSQPIFYQFFRKMKLTILIVTVSILSCFSAETYSQNTKLTLTENNSTLLNVLRTIEAQSEFKFFYNEKVDVNRTVSVVVTQKSVTDILDKVLSSSSIKYKVLGRQIALYDKNEMEPFVAEQQGKKVTGKVADKAGVSLPGVSVVVKGTTKGVITDNDGTYSLANIPENATLQFSFVGMKIQELKVGTQSTLNVVMEDETIGLEEVVAIGYGTMKKSDLTGSLTSVSSEKFSDQNVSRIDQVLQGRASGVQINNTVGAPGGDVRIRIRGANSVLGDNSPLFVVDGFVGVDYNMINPNDIKSVEVLKDAASTAIYGSRGANGVILITTKGGSTDGKVTINYQGSAATSSVVKKYDVLNAADYAETVNAKNKAFGLNDYFTQAQIDEYRRTGGFDYQNAVFREAFSNQHQLSISGGTNKTQYLVSANYLDQKGIINN